MTTADWQMTVFGARGTNRCFFNILNGFAFQQIDRKSALFLLKIFAFPDFVLTKFCL